jgi:hypothetical protein
MVLTIHHTLRAHEALGRPDALPGFLEVVHRLFENGIFVVHDMTIRPGSVRSLDCFASHASMAMGSCSRPPPQEAPPRHQGYPEKHQGS